MLLNKMRQAFIDLLVGSFQVVLAIAVLNPLLTHNGGWVQVAGGSGGLITLLAIIMILTWTEEE